MPALFCEARAYGALLIRNLQPDQADGVLRAIGVHRRARQCCHPVRISAQASRGDQNRLPIGPP
eukprot:3380537-Lingulodinium_polyedra.AAC.1